jgi:HSP20 family protein
MLMRFDPFRELAFRELDRMSQMFGEQGGALQQRTMPIDAFRDGDRFIIRFDLPGVDRDSIELTADKNVLTVRAERTLVVPVAEQAKPRRLQITESGAPQEDAAQNGATQESADQKATISTSA